MSRLPGHRWRTLAWNRKTGEKHTQQFDRKDDVCFDELVIDDWFHLEQMDDRHWWLGIGRGGDMLHVRIQIPAKGQIRVGIEDESEGDLVTYFVGRAGRETRKGATDEPAGPTVLLLPRLRSGGQLRRLPRLRSPCCRRPAQAGEQPMSDRDETMTCSVHGIYWPSELRYQPSPRLPGCPYCHDAMVSRAVAAEAALETLQRECAEEHVLRSAYLEQIGRAETAEAALAEAHTLNASLNQQVEMAVRMLEAAESERDALAEALREIAAPMTETEGDWGSTYDWHETSKARRDIARAALAAPDTEEGT